MLAKGWAVLLLLCAQADPARVFELDDQGTRKVEQGDLAGALPLFEAASARDPGQPGVPVPEYVPRSVVKRQRMLATCLRAVGRRRDEARVRARIVALTRTWNDVGDPERVIDLVDLAVALTAAGERARARAVYEKALPLAAKLPPVDLEPIEGVVDTFSPEGIRQAIAELAAPPARSPEETAHELSLSGASAEAVAVYETMSAAERKDLLPEAYLDWVQAAVRCGRRQSALRAAALAMRVIPDEDKLVGLRMRIQEAAQRGP